VLAFSFAHCLKPAAEKAKNGRLGFERARLAAAPYIVFKVLWRGWEAVPFQDSDAESFSASC
jgi:hypothetical protein